LIAALVALSASLAQTEPPVVVEDGGAGALTEVPIVTRMRAIAYEPYRVQTWLTFADHPRIGPALKRAVEADLVSNADRVYGGAWKLSFAEAPTGAAVTPRASVDTMPDEKGVLAPRAKDYDKILWVEVGVAERRGAVPPLQIAVREYDFEFKTWGPLVVREVRPDEEPGDAAFRLVQRQFRPMLAVVGNDEEKRRINVVVKGYALQPAGGGESMVSVGQPFKVEFDNVIRGKYLGREPLKFTYLIFRTAEPDRSACSCSIMSALGNPITGARLRRGKMLGLAVSTSESASTEVQFVTRQASVLPGGESGVRPVVGYEVYLRPQDQPNPIVVGNTDRRGKITLRPRDLDPDAREDALPRACEVNLRIGRFPVGSFPLVPGDEPRRQVPVNPDPLLPEASGKLQAMQEELIDALAKQAILDRKYDVKQKEFTTFMKDNPDVSAEKLDRLIELQDLAAKISALPKNEYFQTKLAAMKKSLEEQNLKEFNKKSLGRHIAKTFEGIEKLLKDKEIGRTVRVNVDPDLVADLKLRREKKWTPPKVRGESKLKTPDKPKA